MESGDHAFNDAGSIEPSVGPDWDEIESGVSGTGVDREEFEQIAGSVQTIRAVQAVLRFIFQGGIDDQEGIKNRAVVQGWLLLPEYEVLSLTDLARIFHCSKQNISKSVELSKRRFPALRNRHMR